MLIKYRVEESDSMYLKLKTDCMDVDIETNTKYVFIQGSSGVGKSLFIQIIKMILESNVGLGTLLRSSSKCIIIDSNGFAKCINDIIAENDEPIIFLADEFYANKVIMALQNKNAFCIVITRHVPENINYLDKSVYKMVRTDNGITIVGRDAEVS